jgi:hypothetical protein
MRHACSKGSLTWGWLADAGTTRKIDAALLLQGRYTCVWLDYLTIARATGKPAEFRYLAFEVCT